MFSRWCLYSTLVSNHRISSLHLILVGVFGMYCADSAMDAMEGDTRDAFGQQACCTAGLTQTQITQGNLAVPRDSSDLANLSPAFDIEGYQSLIIQIMTTGDSGCEHLQATHLQQIKAELPPGDLTELRAPGIIAGIPVVGKSGHVRLRSLAVPGTNNGNCTANYVVLGLK